MYWPHTVTIYNRTIDIDKTDFSETVTHYITVIEDVLLIANKAANIRDTGLVGADAVTLYIPKSCKAIDGVTGAEKHYVSPLEFQAARDKSELWTLSPNDGNTFFVKGEIVEPNKDEGLISAMYDDCYRVTSVDLKDFGSTFMHHFEVGGV